MSMSLLCDEYRSLIRSMTVVGSMILSVFWELKIWFQAFRGSKIQNFPGAVPIDPLGDLRRPLDPQVKCEATP